jgi:uncharacterized membrane protein (TIGR02234 family)
VAPKTRSARPRLTSRLTIGIAQVLLVVAAGLLWTAARLPWVVIHSFDGLGPPKSATLSGASWSTALLPLALLMLATAVAAVAVRGWPMRLLAGLLAAASFAVGYLGISLWVIPDVAARGADLAHIPVVLLVGSERHYWGAAVAVASAACTLIAAVLLMRLATADRESTTKYAAPAARRSVARGDGASPANPAKPIGDMSERMIWDALDEGRDPTDRSRETDTEGR